MNTIAIAVVLEMPVSSETPGPASMSPSGTMVADSGARKSKEYSRRAERWSATT